MLPMLLTFCLAAAAGASPPSPEDAEMVRRRTAQSSSLTDYLVRDPDLSQVLPKPPLVQDVRKVLMERKPVPHARVAHFDPLKTDPMVLDGLATVLGWSVYVEDVKPLKGGGWIAHINVQARLDPRHAPHRHWVFGEFEEWYRYQGNKLTYLGGMPLIRPGEDGIPRIRRGL